MYKPRSNFGSVLVHFESTRLHLAWKRKRKTKPTLLPHTVAFVTALKIETRVLYRVRGCPRCPRDFVWDRGWANCVLVLPFEVPESFDRGSRGQLAVRRARVGGGSTGHLF